MWKLMHFRVKNGHSFKNWQKMAAAGHHHHLIEVIPSSRFVRNKICYLTLKMYQDKFLQLHFFNSACLFLT
jgi:hypothetical protein